jgi:hypothetical protein
MNIITIAGAALLAQLAFVGAASADIDVNHYQGGRDDMRQHCAGDGRILIDRLDYTFCEDKLAGKASALVK